MFVALHIPQFAMTAGLLKHTNCSRQPCVILTGRNPGMTEEKLPLLAINRIAADAGIHPGWPLSRALVRCPDLRVIPRDPSAEAFLSNALVHHAESLAPDVEITAPDTVVVDLSTRRTPLGNALHQNLIEGTECRHALASTPDLALLAARHAATCGRHIHPRDLVPLPLHILASLPSRESPLPVLELWGLRTLGDFMNLPRQALAERLGPIAGHWHDLLNGKSCRLLHLHRPPESFSQTLDFEDALVLLEPLIFAVKRMLHTLAARLASRHLAAAWLEIRLILENNTPLTRRIHLPEPQAAVEGLLPPLQMFLENLHTPGGIRTLALDAGTTFATAQQREWYGRQLAQPGRWAETLATLEAMVGTGRVGIPLHGNSHHPDSFSVHPLSSGPPTLAANPFRPHSPLPLHRFRPPRPVTVAHESTPTGIIPLALLNGSLPGQIIARRGPFLLSGDWWDPAGTWQRMEWDVQLASRHLLRLAMHTPDNWQLEGIYR